MGAMDAMGGLVLGLVLAYCDSFLVLCGRFCGIEGDLKMDWIGLIRWIPRWGKQQDRIGHDGKQAVSSVDCLPYLRCRLFVLLYQCVCVCVP